MHGEFRRNLGHTDRTIGLIIGLVLLAWPTWLRTGSGWRVALCAIAAFDLIQTIVGY
jgi:hypothetical protein